MRKQRNDKIIGIDIDGTLTDFTSFILNNSVYYMKKNYGCDVKNKSGYDISEIYDLENFFAFHNFSQPLKEVEKAEAKFWNHFFLKYCIWTKFRPNASETINKLKKEDFEIVIVTSRFCSSQNDLKGRCVRALTRLQFAVNGIKPDRIIFCENDDNKCQIINQMQPQYFIDDKIEVLRNLNGSIVKICMTAPYNRAMEFNIRIKHFKEIDYYIRE